MLIGVALLMAIVERVSRGRKDVGQVSLADSMVIGLAQAVAIIPGVSRSGITITAGLLRDIDRAAAARFSFLLSTPAIAAAAAKDCYDLVKTGGIEPGMHLPFFLGISLSAVTGCLVIAFLLKYLRNHSLSLFIYYRVVFGIIVIALAFFRAPAG
jgi:undecaprenyl-diphosphatase